MKEILNIVVTGGPCGGKTTALDELTKYLRSLGYTVYTTSEVATELITDGIRPFGDDKLDIRTFQSFVLDAQIYKEQIRKKAAILCHNSKVAILYDRGILDNRGYIDDNIFDELLKERNLSESEILTRYDLVIHLTTAAIGKEEYYTTLNNSARTETVEQAKSQDQKTLAAWRNHPNLRIVGNDTLFDEKIRKVINYIRAYIGEEEVLRKERYLIDPENINFKEFHHNMIKEDIEEFVLSYDNDDITLYSKSTINDSSYYTCIRKLKGRNEMSRSITEEEYNTYRNKVKGNTISKVRYNFIDEGERFRLDLFNIGGKLINILERDVSNEKRINLPSFCLINWAAATSSNKTASIRFVNKDWIKSLFFPNEVEEFVFLIITSLSNSALSEKLHEFLE